MDKYVRCYVMENFSLKSKRKSVQNCVVRSGMLFGLQTEEKTEGSAGGSRNYQSEVLFESDQDGYDPK